MVCAKLAGIAALRDTENMKDHGAMDTVSFVDAGYTSTVDNKNAVRVTKGAINYLARTSHNFIVIEFGDGILGEYGVMEILKDAMIQKNIVAHVGCAHDPPGALELARICDQIKVPLTVIAGPVTDNSVGIDFVKQRLKVPGFNAKTSGKEMFAYIKENFMRNVKIRGV